MWPIRIDRVQGQHAFFSPFSIPLLCWQISAAPISPRIKQVHKTTMYSIRKPAWFSAGAYGFIKVEAAQGVQHVSQFRRLELRLVEDFSFLFR